MESSSYLLLHVVQDVFEVQVIVVVFDSFSYAALKQRRRLKTSRRHGYPTVGGGFVRWSMWEWAGQLRRGGETYLLFKDERHGKRDGLKEQQHAEDTEELQETRSVSQRQDVQVRIKP